MAAVDQNSNAVLQGLARHVNTLGEDNKLARRKALENIRKDTFSRKPPLDPTEIKPILNEILKPLLKEFSDPVEKCRELSLDILRSFLKSVEKPEEYLPYVIPVLVQRLGQPEITEPSEELRLILVEFLKEILERSEKNIAIYVDDMIKILQRTIIDPFADVKKLACQCTSILAKAVPEHFHMQSESLIKPLLQAISHQHSKVRTIVVYTIGDVIQYGSNKPVDTVVSHLAQRLFDQTPAVRLAVIKVVGNWLLDLCDRYSFWNKLIPLLLTGLSDEQPSIKETADSLWHDVGLKFANENEDDLKDKMDFAKADPKHYPPGVERPNLGCRTLMMRHVSRILPGLMRDVVDWVTETRKKSAGLLYYLLLNCEEYITQHMELLTSGMYKACADEEQSVVKDIQRSAELIGYFVEVEVWSKLILKSVKSSQHFTSMMVLSSVIHGTARDDLKPYIQTILDTLTIPDVCQSVQVAVQVQLLSCLESLLTVSSTDIAESSESTQSVFNLLHTILAIQQGELIKEKVFELLDKLATLEGLDNRKMLYKTHTKPLLDSFHDTYQVWTTHSVERLVFDGLILEAGPVVGDILEDVMPILTANFHPDKDPEVRLKFFSLLSHLMMNCKDTVDSGDKFADFAEIVVRDMILPNCVWKAGRVASAIRTTAVSCAWALLQSGVLTKEKLEPILDNFITQMLASMDDDNKGTRLVACRVMTRTFDLAGGSINQDRLHNMYLELLKRLDDSSDEIRLMVSKTFLAYLDSFEQAYDVQLYRAHLEAMFKGLLVHLDDPDEKIQEAILGVLKKAGGLLPGMLIQEVETTKHKHRSKKYCEELVGYLQKLSTQSS
ncbi:dynein axonemal assembly factor 5-like [Ruditapes philippinarum]|uniref:dynein axonemal assembly factor 5-like n=1 Tax=Ruditapes philippinarum TaxID=129788 RepID=UPI00295B5CD5|nr:dynein axonemal assembly factor 5-like [Ruditapes philippinarum]